MGWIWVARPRTCGACGRHIAGPAEELGPEVAYLTRTGSARCQPCGDAIAPFCPYPSYDAAPRERLDHVPGATPPAPSLYGPAPSSAQPMITPGELLRRNADRANAIARWKERQK